LTGGRYDISAWEKYDIITLGEQRKNEIRRRGLVKASPKDELIGAFVP
jgi:hypothetical protein